MTVITINVNYYFWGQNYDHKINKESITTLTQKLKSQLKKNFEEEIC